MKNKLILLLSVLLSSCTGTDKNTEVEEYLEEELVSTDIVKKHFYDSSFGYYNVNLNSLEFLFDKDLQYFKASPADTYLKRIRKNSASVEIFYYKIVDTTSFYSIIYYSRGEYEQSFDLVNYTKSNELIDNYPLVEIYGDDIYMNYSKIVVKTDSSVIKREFQSHLIDYDSASGRSNEIVDKDLKISLLIKKSGEITVDSIQ